MASFGNLGGQYEKFPSGDSSKKESVFTNYIDRPLNSRKYTEEAHSKSVQMSMESRLLFFEYIFPLATDKRDESNTSHTAMELKVEPTSK